jgi:hypothetical protein
MTATGAAVALLAAASPTAGHAQGAAPGQAQSPLRLGLGGYFQAYGVFVSQPDGPGEYGADRRSFDIKREAEVFFTGRVKLDNGLTVGVQVELKAETAATRSTETASSRAAGAESSAPRTRPPTSCPGPPPSTLRQHRH